MARCNQRPHQRLRHRNTEDCKLTHDSRFGHKANDCVACYAATPMRRLIIAVLLLCPCISTAQTKPDSLDDLASQFWSWRAKYRPFTFDDVPRIERPGGMRDWSTPAIVRQRADLGVFERRWNALDTTAWPIAQKVDYRLIGSAIARVRWGLDINPRWQRDPTFYIEQTVGALQDELLQPPPFEEARAAELLIRAENIPSILDQAKTNLKPVATFAKLAIAGLGDIEARMQRVERAVSPLLHDDAQRARFSSAIGKASKSLADFRDDLKRGLPTMRREFALGREAYSFFLHRVALLPYTPEQLLTMARQDFERVLSDEALERQRNLGVPELTLPATPRRKSNGWSVPTLRFAASWLRTESCPSPATFRTGPCALRRII